jgi:hypothetical protein
VVAIRPNPITEREAKMRRLTLKRLFAVAAASMTAIALTAVPASPTALAVSPAETPTQVGVIGGSGGSGALFTKQDLPPSSSSSSFTWLGGILIAAPAVVSVPDATGVQAGQPLYIGTGQDHALWVRSLTQSWQHLSSRPNYCIDNPAAVVVRGPAAGQLVLTVACQGADHALWYAQEGGVTRGALPPTGLNFNSLGGVLVSGPAVAVVNPRTVPSELTFFGDGLDGHVYMRTLRSAWTQTVWECIGHPAAGGSLSTYNPQAYTQIAAFACTGKDHTLWTSRNIGAGWEAARSWGAALVDGPGIAVTPTWFTVYVELTLTRLFHISISPQNIPTGFIDDGGTVQYGAGAAALLYRDDNP